MATIKRIRVAMTAFIGGPGVMTFYTNDVAAFTPVLHSTLTDLQAYFPSGMRLAIEPLADHLDDTSGELVGQEAVTPGTSLLAFGTGNYAAPAGLCFEWHSETVVDGRRGRGRTFIVPLAGQHLSADGSITDASLTTLQSIANATVHDAPGAMLLWHRPKFGPRPVGGGSRPIVRAGASTVATSSSVRDKVAVLKSRRD